MNAKNDAALVAECLGGDNRAFETLVRKYEKAVYNVALRMLGAPEDAEDIAQTVFVKAYEKLDTYDSAHQFFSWIYRIAVNESINYSKRSKRIQEYESGMTPSLEEAPDRSADEGDLAEVVAGAIRELSIDYRMVIVLRHYHDFSYQEIGEILSLPEKTVKSRLFTARQRLKEFLEARGIRP